MILPNVQDSIILTWCVLNYINDVLIYNEMFSGCGHKKRTNVSQLSCECRVLHNSVLCNKRRGLETIQEHILYCYCVNNVNTWVPISRLEALIRNSGGRRAERLPRVRYTHFQGRASLPVELDTCSCKLWIWIVWGMMRHISWHLKQLRCYVLHNIVVVLRLREACLCDMFTSSLINTPTGV